MGRKNKKGQEMRDLAVNPEEAETVRRIFKLTIQEGYGSHQIAAILNKEGKRTHKGAEFQCTTILRLLKNELCRGFIVNGGVKSERIERLQIISDADFLRAQEILKQRANKNDEKRTIAISNKGKALLSGNVFCMHCGSRLATSRYREAYVDVNGETRYYEYGRYVCYHRSRGLNECDGMSTYKADKIDAAVMAVMRNIFSKISGCPKEEKIQSAYKKMMAENHQTQKKLEESLKKDKAQLATLRLEIGKVLTGDSDFTNEDLQSAITTLKERIKQAEEKLETLKDEDAQKKAVSENVIPAYHQFKSWAEEFDDASLQTKKMIACQLFSRVEIGKGYRIHLEMNMTYKQFCEDWIGEADFMANEECCY